MGRFTTAKHYVALSILLPISVLFIWPGKMWLAAIPIVWLIAVAIFWVRSERKEYEERMTRMIHAMHSSSVRTLNHHRHDWMNDLQVLFGYARLQKLDKTIEYVERIKERMTNESNIAKLGVPSLVNYIQSYRTLTSSVVLEVVIQENLQIDAMNIDGEKVAETLIQTINAYRMAAKVSLEIPSVLRVELSKDNEALYAAFYYEGELINEKQWKHKIQQQLEGAVMQPISFEQTFSKMLLKADVRA